MDKKSIFSSFIDTFLPPKGNLRKNTGNELKYIHTTLNLFCKKHFGFNLTQDEILLAFDQKGYDIFTRQGKWDSELKDVKPSGQSLKISGNVVVPTNIEKDLFGPLHANDASFIYIDIKAPVVRQMRRSLTKLDPKISNQKTKEVLDLLYQLRQFKSQYNLP